MLLDPIPSHLCQMGILDHLLRCIHEAPGSAARLPAITILSNIAWMSMLAADDY